ncbi:MAG: OmpA family protein [Rhodospirillales bacterium]|nr:OmpA family protein [Rhodospirillales bacterium]
MLKKLLAAGIVALVLGACSEPAPPPPPPPPPPAQPTSFMVFFDWDRSNLSTQAMNTIQQAATAYKTRGSARVTATGHTDTSGPDGYNMALSLRRANAVKNALVAEGVPATAIQVVGRGEQSPMVQTGDGVREPQNRRVEIVMDGAVAQVPAVFNDPASYCKALSDKWRQYRTLRTDTPEAAAIAKCEAGDYAAGIPVLEEAHIANSIPLPAPGYRWPGRPISPS